MNISWLGGIYGPVRLVKTVLIVLLTLVWASASHHCKLKYIPGLEFLACSDHAEDESHQNNGCETDGCAFETQLYKTENAQDSVPAPLILFAPFLILEWAELSSPESVNHILPDAAPVELPRVWQFFYRTALPPRAPSPLS